MIRVCKLARVLVVSVLGAGLVACGGGGSEGEESDGLPLVVATTRMVGDLAREVGGQRVDVDELMGPGVDPHLYRMKPTDRRRIARADLVLYNGLHLEGRLAVVLDQLAEQGRAVHAVASVLPAEKLLADDEGAADPHVWGDMALWAETVDGVVAAFSRIDPEGAEEFRARGDAYRARLLAAHEEAVELARRIPEERRVLVTSHDAFGYFGRAYGFEVVGVQGMSTASAPGLADQVAVVDLVRSRGVKAVFGESSVPGALVMSVARDAGVPLGGELFSDSMGAPGELREVAGEEFDTGTYLGMIRYNLQTVVSALE